MKDYRLYTIRSGRDKLLVPVLFTLVWALYTILEQFTPFQYDNVLFDAAYRSVSGEGCPFSFDSYMAYIECIREGDNWRLSNILAPMTTLFLPGKIWFSLLTGLCMAVSVITATRLVRFRHHMNWCVMAFVWLGMTVFLPWRNSILTGDYALNYIFGTAIALLAFRYTLEAAQRTAPVKMKVLAVALCVLTGFWHESFGVALASGLGGWCLVSRFKCPRIIPVCAILVFAVSITWAFNSNMLNRAASELSVPSWRENIIAVVWNNLLTVVLLCALAVSLLFSRLRVSLVAMLSNPVFVIAACSALAGFFISAMTHLSARTAFWPQACSLIALMAWLQQLCWQRIRESRWVKAAATATVFLLLAQGAYAAYYVRLAGKQYENAVAGMSQSENGTFFYDMLQSEDFPILTLGMPSRTVMVDPFTFFCFDAYYGADRQFALVPESLSLRLDDDDVTEPVGDSGYLRRTTSGKDLYATVPPGEDRYGTLNVPVSVLDGRTILGYPVFYIRFIGTDGKDYYYLKPLKLPPSEVTDIEFAKFAN